jgi:DNA-binding beta-propeller fold protein YncE
MTFSFSPDYRQLVATSRKAGGGQVIDLDTGHVVTDIPLSGMPHLGSGTYWQRNGEWVFATPNISKGQISVIDLKTWTLIKQIPTLGPGFFMRSHANSRYVWSDVFFGPDNDAIHLIDKQTPGNRPHPTPNAGQDRRPRGIHPRRPLPVAEHLGQRWSVDRL